MSNKYLKEELERSRLETQKLLSELSEFYTFRKVFLRLLRLIILDPYFKLTGKNYKDTHKIDKIFVDNKFKPYQLRLKNANSNIEKKKVLHAIPNVKTGGATRIIVDIIEYLSDKYEHKVITRHKPSPEHYKGLDVEEFYYVPTLSDMVGFLKKFNPSIIHLHYAYRLNEDIALWRWFKVIADAAEVLDVKIIENINSADYPLYSPSISKYVFVSDYVKEVFSFIRGSNITVYPGSDFTHFSNKKTDYGKTIGMVYRLDDDKLRKESVEPFIDAVKLDENIQVLIIGDGELLSHYKQRVKEEGVETHFEFPGYVPYEELPEYYKKLDVFVAPVFEESFGQVSPFAMNMHIPVVAYDTGALKEIVNNDSLITETGDHEGLAKIIVDLLNDKEKCREIGRYNHERAQGKFSLEAMVNAYRDLYQTVLNKEN